MASKHTKKYQRSTRHLFRAWSNQFRASLSDIPEKFNAFMAERGIVWPSAKEK